MYKPYVVKVCAILLIHKTGKTRYSNIPAISTKKAKNMAVRLCFLLFSVYRKWCESNKEGANVVGKIK